MWDEIGVDGNKAAGCMTVVKEELPLTFPEVHRWDSGIAGTAQCWLMCAEDA